MELPISGCSPVADQRVRNGSVESSISAGTDQTCPPQSGSHLLVVGEGSPSLSTQNGRSTRGRFTSSERRRNHDQKDRRTPDRQEPREASWVWQVFQAVLSRIRGNTCGVRSRCSEMGWSNHAGEIVAPTAMPHPAFLERLYMGPRPPGASPSATFQLSPCSSPTRIRSWARSRSSS